MRLVVPIVIVASVCSSAQASVITIEGTIKSVDAKKRTITVETGSESKSFDVSSKVKISNEGNDANLVSLQAGQKVKLTYHDNLEIVLKIDVTVPNPKGGDEIALFDGKTLNGWQFQTLKDRPAKANDCWIVDGERQVLSGLGNGYNWLKTRGEYEDFTARLEWRFPPGQRITPSGSGFVVRSVPGSDPNSRVPVGIEVQIGNATSGDFWGIATTLQTERPSPERKGLFLRKLSAEKPIGEWNSLEVRCEGDRITATVNGVMVNNGVGAARRAGCICLLSQGSPIEFRNIRLAPLASSNAAK